MSKPCERCGAELTAKDWGNGGIVLNDASGRIHGPESCLIAQLFDARAKALSIDDLASARLSDFDLSEAVRHDFAEIHRLAKGILKS